MQLGNQSSTLKQMWNRGKTGEDSGTDTESRSAASRSPDKLASWNGLFKKHDLLGHPHKLFGGLKFPPGHPLLPGGLAADALIFF